MFSSDPISPFMEGSGNVLDDDEGRGSFILVSAGVSSVKGPWSGVSAVLCEMKPVWLMYGWFLGT